MSKTAARALRKAIRTTKRRARYREITTDTDPKGVQRFIGKRPDASERRTVEQMQFALEVLDPTARPHDTAIADLDLTDGLILRALNNAGRALSMNDLAIHAQRDRKTCGNRINKKLEPKKLVKRIGAKGPIAITLAGRAAFGGMMDTLPPQ